MKKQNSIGLRKLYWVCLTILTLTIFTAGFSDTGYGQLKFPPLTGRVVDNAGMLTSADNALLIRSLEEFEKQSSDQIVVATIPSLEGENLEDFANRLFRYWELGQAEENNGVLLLIAKNDRKIRIEVGYGLEGVLTDALSKTIIDQVIVPQFKRANFSTGIVEGVSSIISVLSGNSEELKARQERNSSDSRDEWLGSLFFIIWITFLLVPVMFGLLARMFGKKIGKHRYRWLGIEVNNRPGSGSFSSGSSGRSSGGFSGGGGSSGGGGASGGW